MPKQVLGFEETVNTYGSNEKELYIADKYIKYAIIERIIGLYDRMVDTY